jgi:Raf kinase inhibitor-like YbhB/YbcL family protein
MNKQLIITILFVMSIFIGCEPEETEQTKQKGETMALNVTSSAFEHNGMIPAKYTADGADVSPPLDWEGVPEGTESLVVICDDPDAPMGTWVHWLAWNIPPTAAGLNENVPPDAVLKNGICQGTTDFGRIGYGGPAPPSGTHRYFFKVYALDTTLDLPADSVKQELEDAMEGHILAQGELIGKYSRSR